MSAKQLTKRTATAASAGALVAVGMLATAGSAAASPAPAPGEITVCAAGQHLALVHLPGRDTTTGLVAPGQCDTLGGLGTSEQPEDIVVMGGDYSDLSEIGRESFRPSKGAVVTTYGTVGDLWYTTTHG